MFCSVNSRLTGNKSNAYFSEAEVAKKETKSAPSKKGIVLRDLALLSTYNKANS